MSTSLKSFGRRKLMVSAGASLLLKPFIDCIEAHADGPALEPCFLTMFKGQCQYGGAAKPDTFDVAARNWVPTMAGDTIKMSPVLAPFEKVKSYMTFAIGLDIATTPPDKHWTCPTLFTGSNNRNAPDNNWRADNESLDFYVARRMGKGAEPLVMNPYTRFSGKSDGDMVSWGRDAQGKLFKKIPYDDPLKMFNDLFSGGLPTGAGTDTARLAAIARAKKSVLDAIREDATRISAKAAPEHRPQIESTLDGIRELEASLVGKDGKPTEGMMEQCLKPGTPTSSGATTFDSEANLSRTMNAFVDVTLAAMRCGLRRVVSFQFLDVDCQKFVPAKIRPQWKHATFGVTPYHFEHSHFPNGNVWIETEQYIHGFYARLLEGMMNTPAGTTNLLEKSLGMYATTMSHNHFANAASYFVVGSAGGRLKSNRILQYGNPYTSANSGKPHNDLLVSVLQAFGYDDVKSYGDPKLCKGGLAGFL